MNYNANHRIRQVTETTLIIGTDIAKKTHVARVQDFRGIELGKSLTFGNDLPSFNRLLLWINQHKTKHKKDNVLFGVEPTGHYWQPLVNFLKFHGIRVVMVNPYHVKKSKELEDNSPTKNDIKDARLIGQLVKDGRFLEPMMPTGIYAELREAMNSRERLQEDIVRIKVQVTTWLDRFFPEFLTVFKDWTGQASISSLQNFPLPKDVDSMTAEEIVKCWRKTIRTGVGLIKANLLKEAAGRSIGLSQGSVMAIRELHRLIGQYLLLLSHNEQLEEDIERLLKQLPEAAAMLTVPGVGVVTVAGFISETGDLNNYNHPRQIQKLAGLNLKESSSGQHKGETRITKRGRRRLRRLLYLAARTMVKTNSEFAIIHYWLKTRPQNPLKGKQSLIALSCKLIRIFFTLGTKGIPYDPDQVLDPVRKDQIQLAA